MIVDIVYRKFLNIVVSLFDLIIPIVRKIRYFLLLPCTPILKPITEFIFSRIGVKITSEAKSHPDIFVKDTRFYARLWSDHQLGFEEMYTEGWWTSENLEQLYDKMFIFINKYRWIMKVHIAYWEGKFRWGILNTVREDSNQIKAPEYELPVEYFKLITDQENMQHSCGYFATGASTFAEAQVETLKLIASKLQLRPGMTLLDVGCGFGGLSKFMGENYGVTVTGVTPSDSMAKTARTHCCRSQVTILQQDWRQMEGKFDRITIIEMLDHVGKQNYDEFFRKIQSLLKPDGRVLLQHYAMDPGHFHFTEFLCKYQYGLIYFPTLSNVVSHASNYFHISNVHDISCDAEETYKHFIDMVETNREKMTTLTGPKVWKALRITYALAQGGLKCRAIKAYQTILVRKDNKGRVPLK